MRTHQTKTGEIKAELRKAMELLGADRELLATLGSWQDTLDDAEILEKLKEWNASKASERL
jgi:hypothetical protein